MSNLYKQLETVISINGHEVAAIIRIETEFDETFGLDDIDFENEEEKARFERKLSRGELEPTFLRVEVYALGENGSDALGGVLVAKSEDLDNTVKEHDMIENATDELIKAIEAKFNTLKPYFQAA